MGKLRQTALVLGEGPTEFFYFKSLCDVFKRLTIKPDYPKHTNLKELEAKITEGIALGYNNIFCIIDMDTKDREPERTQYERLKAKYAKPVNKPKKGIFVEWNFLKRIAVPSCFSFTTSAILHVHTKGRMHYSRS